MCHFWWVENTKCPENFSLEFLRLMEIADLSLSIRLPELILQLQLNDSSGYVRPSTFCMSSMVVRSCILGALVTWSLQMRHPKISTWKTASLKLLV